MLDLADALAVGDVGRDQENVVALGDRSRGNRGKVADVLDAAGPGVGPGKTRRETPTDAA